MGKIWTPGEPEEPRPQGGIELPKGYSRQRKQEQTAPAEAPASASGPSQPESPSPREAAPQRTQQPAFLFPPAGAQVQCPNCGNTFVTPVFSIIDLGANPELKQAILGGQINVAICPQCGSGGSLSAPLMVHEPNHQFLGVYVPPQAQLSDVQTQKMIGEMTQALMSKLPSESRRGYMLQAQQYMDWDRFLEKLWGFEGVTPEMLRRRREQGNLLNSLLQVVDDEEAMRLVVERNKNLVDMEFFSLLAQMYQVYAAQNQTEIVGQLEKLRQYLMEHTEVGGEVKAQEDHIQQYLARLKPQMGRAELLDLLVDAWQDEDGEAITSIIVSAVLPLIDYSFLMELARRIDETSEPEQVKVLEDLRQFLLEVQEEQRESGEAIMQRVQALLQEVLQAPDTEGALRQRADQIDEVFLNVLAANMRQAQQSKAQAAANRLRQVYEQALSIFEERMPDDMRLLNRLLRAPDEAASRRLLQENRELLTAEFVESMKSLEEEARNDGSTQLASRLKSLRGQVALMR